MLNPGCWCQTHPSSLFSFGQTLLFREIYTRRQILSRVLRRLFMGQINGLIPWLTNWLTRVRAETRGIGRDQYIRTEEKRIKNPDQFISRPKAGLVQSWKNKKARLKRNQVWLTIELQLEMFSLRVHINAGMCVCMYYLNSLGYPHALLRQSPLVLSRIRLLFIIMVDVFQS